MRHFCTGVGRKKSLFLFKKLDIVVDSKMSLFIGPSEIKMTEMLEISIIEEEKTQCKTLICFFLLVWVFSFCFFITIVHPFAGGPIQVLDVVKSARNSNAAGSIGIA